MDSLLSALPTPTKRDQVFISYSRHDRDWLHKVQDSLKPLFRTRPIRLWDDLQIQPGAEWLLEIKAAMAATKVAVLLVSRNYLASDFINNVELNTFFKARNEGVKVLWVAITASGWRKTPLNDLQCVTRDPDNGFLTAMTASDQEKELVRLSEEIEKALNS